MFLRSFAVMLGMLTLGAYPATVWADVAVPVQTDSEAARAATLSDLLMIDQLISVMRDEGLAYGVEMEAEMFPGQGKAAWKAAVMLIYDAPDMKARFDAAFAEALAGSPEVGAIEAFFASDLGQRALKLEIEARRTLLDPAAEEAAKAAFAQMQANGDDRVAALEGFVTANGLIEANVMGGLNSNLAFYRGLADVGAFQDAMPEDQMLADVWAQEPDIRGETTEWLYPYLALAYKPLSDTDLAAYQAFSETSAGQAINHALFAAFDAVFVTVSRDLGRAAAQQMQGQEL